MERKTKIIVYKIVGIEKVKAERFGRTDSEEAKRIQEGKAPETFPRVRSACQDSSHDSIAVIF